MDGAVVVVLVVPLLDVGPDPAGVIEPAVACGDLDHLVEATSPVGWIRRVLGTRL